MDDTSKLSGQQQFSQDEKIVYIPDDLHLTLCNIFDTIKDVQHELQNVAKSMKTTEDSSFI